MASTQSKGSDWGITAFLTLYAISENLVTPLHFRNFLANCMCPENFGQEEAISDKVTSTILEKQPKFGH